MTLLFALVACGQPAHLQYDYARSYADAFVAQADRQRPTAADALYEISGKEGILLREAMSEALFSEAGGENLEKTLTTDVE